MKPCASVVRVPHVRSSCSLLFGCTTAPEKSALSRTLCARPVFSLLLCERWSMGRHQACGEDRVRTPTQRPLRTEKVNQFMTSF